MKLYLVAGERSGDSRGAELMRALQERLPGVEFYGAGGPEMQAIAGPHLFDWVAEAVVGLWDVLKKYGYFRAQFHRMRREIAELKPDAVIFIDYPGFNLRLAAAIRGQVPGMKSIYYISPQVWAWHRGRIPKMARNLDLMLCLFPFEKPLYEESGLATVLVGHPLLDSLERKRPSEPRVEKLVALLPGSREREVRKIFPPMLETARLLAAEDGELRFAAAAASPEMLELMADLRTEAGLTPEDCEISLRTSHELMQRATVGMVASGTATLEAAFFGLPMVILYKVAWLTWVVGKQLVKVPHLGMPNLLAGEEIAREFLQGTAQPKVMAAELRRMLRDPAARAEVQGKLAGVIAGLGERGAGARAAAAIAEALEGAARR